MADEDHDDHWDDRKGDWSVPTTSWLTITEEPNEDEESEVEQESSQVTHFSSQTTQQSSSSSSQGTADFGINWNRPFRPHPRHQPDDYPNWQHRPLLNKALHNAYPFVNSSVPALNIDDPTHRAKNRQNYNASTQPVGNDTQMFWPVFQDEQEDQEE